MIWEHDWTMSFQRPKTYSMICLSVSLLLNKLLPKLVRNTLHVKHYITAHLCTLLNFLPTSQNGSLLGKCYEKLEKKGVVFTPEWQWQSTKLPINVRSERWLRVSFLFSMYFTSLLLMSSANVPATKSTWIIRGLVVHDLANYKFKY